MGRRKDICVHPDPMDYGPPDPLPDIENHMLDKEPEY